uniref:Uncharacterized protein n=1 Tax=Plectus sambesii TaxID=2011161 RepID=A0A914ULC3_9BILA
MTWGWKHQLEEKNKKSCQPSETTVSEADEGVSTDTDERQEFDQNGSKWTTCCGCHVATLTFVWGTTFTIAVAIIELGLTCLGLLRNTVRSAEMCGASEERRPQMEQQYHKEEYKKPNDRSGNFSTLTVKESTYWDNYGIVTMIVCSMLQSQIFWSIVEIVTVVMLLYGIKARRWGFLVPHLILRGLFLLGVALGFLAMSIYTLYFFISINGDSHVMSAEQIRTIMIIFSLVLGAVLALYIYIFVCTIRCCQFVKEAAKAGILSTVYPSAPLPMITVSHGNTFTAPQYPYPQQYLPALKLAQEPPPAYATIASAPPSTKAD